MFDEGDRKIFVSLVIVFVCGVAAGFALSDVISGGKTVISGADVEGVLSAMCVERGFSPTVGHVMTGPNSFTVECGGWNINVTVSQWN
jgi:hypothetical protein